MSDERERVYLDLHKNFVKQDLPGSNGGTFNSVTIPAGVIVDGKDIGGYKFYPLYVNESRRSENWRTIPLLTDKDIQLGKTHLDKDGGPLLDEKGERIIDVVRVSAQQLVSAVELARQAYREEHPREVVWTNIHKSFAKDKGLYWSVGLAPGTIIDGKDYGNYRFSVLGVNPSQFNENVLGIPLEPERNYRLAGDENFSDVVYVKGSVLKEAIDEERAAYRAAREAEQAEDEMEPPGEGWFMEEEMGDLDEEIDLATLAAADAMFDSPFRSEREQLPEPAGR